MEEYIAHVRKSDSEKQSLKSHLESVAELAKELAAKLNLGKSGELLGLMHDFGKYSQSFQAYIKAVTGIDPDADDYVLPGGKKIDHSTAGAAVGLSCVEKIRGGTGYRRVVRTNTRFMYRVAPRRGID